MPEWRVSLNLTVLTRHAGMQSRRASVARRNAGASALGSHVARGNQKNSVFSRSQAPAWEPIPRSSSFANQRNWSLQEYAPCWSPHSCLKSLRACSLSWWRGLGWGELNQQNTFIWFPSPYPLPLERMCCASRCSIVTLIFCKYAHNRESRRIRKLNLMCIGGFKHDTKRSNDDQNI